MRQVGHRRRSLGAVLVAENDPIGRLLVRDLLLGLLELRVQVGERGRGLAPRRRDAGVPAGALVGDLRREVLALVVCQLGQRRLALRFEVRLVCRGRAALGLARRAPCPASATRVAVSSALRPCAFARRAALSRARCAWRCVRS
jgi:hypothetical protein